MGTREAISDVIGGEESMKRGIDELAAIITLHAFDDRVKLSVNESEEALENGGGVGFVSEGKRPCEMRKVI